MLAEKASRKVRTSKKLSSKPPDSEVPQTSRTVHPSPRVVHRLKEPSPLAPRVVTSINMKVKASPMSELVRQTEEELSKYRKRTHIPTAQPFIIPQDSKDRLELPPIQEWRSAFGPIQGDLKGRIVVHNAQSAAAMAEGFVPAGCKDQVVIEAFPGPGALTRALLNLPKRRISKLIIIENVEQYLKYLKVRHRLVLSDCSTS